MSPLLHLRAPGLWADRRTSRSGVPALFLDRDGVVVEEVDYLRRREDVRLIPGVNETIRRMNQQNIAVVIVTNQAGVARGYFDWPTFADVQSEIDEQLRREGAVVDALYACGYHGEGHAPLDVADHPWRKPNPGMILAALDELALDAGRSWFVGDRAGDLRAAKAAGLPGGTLVAGGYGSDPTEIGAAEALNSPTFRVERAPSLRAAESRF